MPFPKAIGMTNHVHLIVRTADKDVNLVFSVRDIK